MIKFKEINNLLIFSYIPMNGTDWIKKEFKKNCGITIKKTFHFSNNDVYGEIDEDKVDFIIARLDGDYYKFDKDIFDIFLDIFIFKNIDVEWDIKLFVANNNKSLFEEIANLLANSETEIRIGINKDDNLPWDIFKKTIKNFPTTTELKHYANMRIDTIIKDYLDTNKDYEERYNRYMDKKPFRRGFDVYDYFDEYEIDKYKKILAKLKYMLENEAKYTERQWQKEILQIIRLIYPKYIAVFENVKIRDVYKPTNRFLDFMLIDANGNTDIVEIKKPFGKKGIVTSSVYRDNHVPVRELSGSIMQIEKYIFYLNKWGKTGEDELTKRYASRLPEDFKIKITNPHALIIMGRDGSMNPKQQEDFEIIKRKYKNVADILTYDDLVKRLENTIEMYGKGYTK